MAKVNPIHVQKFLKGVDYPVDKDTLIRHARERGADETVVRALQQIPMDRFNSPNDVAGGIGKIEAA